MYFHLKNFNSKHNGCNTNFLPQQFGNSHVQDIHRFERIFDDRFSDLGSRDTAQGYR